jgi:hypothetical protein
MNDIIQKYILFEHFLSFLKQVFKYVTMVAGSSPFQLTILTVWGIGP